MATIPAPVKTFDNSGHIKTVENLLYVVQQLSAARNMDTVMKIVRHSVRELTGSDGATFVLRDDDKCYYADEDAISPLWKGNRYPMSACISGWVMLNKKPAIIEDIYQDSRIPIDVYKKTFVKSLAMVPIKISSPLGAIGCYWAKRHLATEDETMVLQVIADTAAISVDNIRYEDLIKEKALQLEEAMKGTLLAIARMVEQKDLYTFGYQRRVSLIGTAIAKELGWDIEQQDRIRLAGIVHDIGKIGIPSELLSKPARLTDYEYALVKTHSSAGYDILKDIPHLLEIAEIILQHHERLDGSGYPNGLKGDEILPEAQVIAVADVFESMTSHRPYRPALGTDMAIAELLQNRGSFYKPEIVDAIVRLVREKGYTIPE